MARFCLARMQAQERVNDAALPRWGKGRCGGAGATLFAPMGQRRCCVARLILAGLRGKACCGAVCLSGRAGRRAGRTGGGGAQSARDGYTRPTPSTPSYGRKRALSPLRRPRRRPSSTRPATAIFPRHPAGRTAGSARTRPRDQSLGYPLLGTGPLLLGRARRLMGENAPFPRFATRGNDRLAAPPATTILPRHPAGEDVRALPAPAQGSGP